MGSNSIPSNSNIDRGTTAARPTAPSIGTPYFNGTTAELQVYTAAGWAAVNAVPFPVNTVAFTNTGGANNYSTTAGAGNVSFIAGVGGGTPTSYIVTPSPTTSPAIFTGSSSPVAVSNLLPGQSYTFSVTATNNYGVSAASAVVATPTTKPQAPTLNSVTQAANNYSLSFTNNSNAGSAITSMSITSSPSVALTYSGTTSPMTISGSFVSGQAYTFSVSAVNANGTGASSQITSSSYLGLATTGYMMGGTNATVASQSTFNANITKYTMSNDTNANIAATSPTAKGYAVCLGQKSNVGGIYAIGSFTTNTGNSIHKLLVSNETTSNLGSIFGVSSVNSGFANADIQGTSGLVGNGSFGGAINRFSYSTDSLSALSTFPYSPVSTNVSLNGDGVHSWIFTTSGTGGALTHAGYKHTTSGDTWSSSSAPYMTSVAYSPQYANVPGYGDQVYGWAATQGSTSSWEGIGRFAYSTVTWSSAVPFYATTEWPNGQDMQVMYAPFYSGNGFGYLAGGNVYSYLYPISKTYKHNISAGTVSEIASAFTSRGGTAGGANGI